MFNVNHSVKLWRESRTSQYVNYLWPFVQEAQLLQTHEFGICCVCWLASSERSSELSGLGTWPTPKLLLFVFLVLCRSRCNTVISYTCLSVEWSVLKVDYVVFTWHYRTANWTHPSLLVYVQFAESFRCWKTFCFWYNTSSTSASVDGRSAVVCPPVCSTFASDAFATASNIHNSVAR